MRPLPETWAGAVTAAASTVDSAILKTRVGIAPNAAAETSLPVFKSEVPHWAWITWSLANTVGSSVAFTTGIIHITPNMHVPPAIHPPLQAVFLAVVAPVTAKETPYFVFAVAVPPISLTFAAMGMMSAAVVVSAIAIAVPTARVAGLMRTSLCQSPDAAAKFPVVKPSVALSVYVAAAIVAFMKQIALLSVLARVVWPEVAGAPGVIDKQRDRLLDPLPKPTGEAACVFAREIRILRVAWSPLEYAAFIAKAVAYVT